MDTTATVLANSYESVRTTLRTVIVGVGGYAGGELARLLLNHPRATPHLLQIQHVAHTGYCDIGFELAKTASNSSWFPASTIS
jgi:N-acetyl-gamma-glutamylphosphate reductase